ncbi:MAG: type 4a pilus biogenesis protein PilO [Thermodesulfovibrionales bacterium]|nr:type 4a pilus biogenesis protein PilO [Thermodesulfovibrionales bacterium]
MRRNILFLLLGATIVLILHNYIEDRRQELQEEIFKIQKRLTRAAERQSSAETEKNNVQRTRLFDASSSTRALSELQAFITDTAKASGIEILSVRPSPVIKYTYHEGVVLYLEAKGDAQDIEKFLERIHSAQRAFFITKLILNHASSENPGELKLTMEIAGLRTL